MSALWPDIPSRIAVPSIPRESLFDSSGEATAWIPGMKPTSKWNLVLMHGGNLNRYKQCGGDPEKLIVHHLSHDSGIINPLWGKKSFMKRAERLRGFGCKTVVAADFSSWADMPIPAQLYNVYRTSVVAKDFALAGFKIIPVAYWSHPRLAEFQILSYGENLPCAVVDMMHVGTKGAAINEELFWSGAEIFARCHPNATVWLWSCSRVYVEQWGRRIGRCKWVPSRVYVLNKLHECCRRASRLEKQQTQEKTCQV